ncbi:MAG: hypothetical protein HDT39_09435 [Lachnospiraceae bacterium]|nr:hypothetical protein [Lachnospiraceae bacterium]
MKRIIKMLAMAVFVLVIMSFMGGMDIVRAAESALVEFNYDASGKIAGEKLVEYGDKDGYNPTNGRGTLLCYMDSSAPRALEWSDPEYNNNGANIVPIVRASIKNKWGNTPSFLISLSTKGYTNVKFSAMLAGSSNGPAQWKLQYSIDGTNFNDIQSSNITIPYDTRKTMTSYYNGFALPNEVSDRDIVYIRIISPSTVTVAGGDYLRLPSGGETAINGIRVVGTDIASITTAPAPVTTKAPETTKPAEQNTTAAQPTTTTNGGQNPTTVKPTAGGGETTTKSDNHNTNNTDNIGGETTSQQGEMSTHIVTQTNASGETITSIVYDETTELLTDENGETITENEKETIKESEDESPDEEKSVSKKKKTATSGNIEKESKETSKKDGNNIIVIVVLAAVLAVGIGAAVIVQKKKSKTED